MPKVRILQSVSGVDFSWQPDEVVEMSAEDAGKWADGYRAELVRGERPERAVQAPAPETADAAPAKPRRRRTTKES